MQTLKTLFVLLAAAVLVAQGFELPRLKAALGAVKNKTAKGIEAVKNSPPVEVLGNKYTSVKGSKPFKAVGTGVHIAKSVTKKVISAPSAILDDIVVNIPDPKEIAKNLTNLVNTTAIFRKGNESLNCFGLPVAFFDKTLEKIFMQTTQAEDVRFYFSSRRSPAQKTFHVQEDFTLDQVDFDVTRPTVVVVHGFMSSGKESWTRDMAAAFLKLYDANTIIVDWQKGSNTWNYFSAALSTRIVGLQLAKLFAKIRDQAIAEGHSPASISEWGPIHLVGHSLGSHISAHAAYLIKKSQEDQQESWIVDRITGLDPAQPCFSIADETLKLDRHDAPYVDVIHTNARHLLFLGLGLPDQLGYVDFYPNGGEAQPGCGDIDTSYWKFILIPANYLKETVCSHGRSHAFLTESMANLVANNCTFMGYRWNPKAGSSGRKWKKESCTISTCTEMGVTSSDNYPLNAGSFFVPTRAEAPFCDERYSL